MKLLGVQYLRAVAALMVVVFHIRPRIEAMGYAGGWPEWMQAGVDVFFVISGFIMWVTTEQPTTSVRFIRNRLVRIVPLYWTVTTVAVLLTGTVSWHTAASYLFLPAMHPTAGEYWPVVIPGWTLNYEMFFYVLFAMALTLPRRFQMLVMAAVLGTLAALDLQGPLGFYTDSIVLEFVFGMALAAYRPNLRWAGLVSGFVLFALLEPLGLPRFIGYGIPALLIVGAVASLEPVRAVRLPALLGDASYSIYLVHGFALVALAKVWPWGWQAFIPAALVWCSLAGVAVYWIVEKPSIAWFRGRSGRHSTQTSQTRPEPHPP